jgi:hypothetical protein
MACQAAADRCDPSSHDASEAQPPRRVDASSPSARSRSTASARVCASSVGRVRAARGRDDAARRCYVGLTGSPSARRATIAQSSGWSGSRRVIVPSASTDRCQSPPPPPPKATAHPSPMAPRTQPGISSSRLPPVPSRARSVTFSSLGASFMATATLERRKTFGIRVALGARSPLIRRNPRRSAGSCASGRSERTRAATRVRGPRVRFRVRSARPARGQRRSRRAPAPYGLSLGGSPSVPRLIAVSTRIADA